MPPATAQAPSGYSVASAAPITRNAALGQNRTSDPPRAHGTTFGRTRNLREHLRVAGNSPPSRRPLGGMAPPRPPQPGRYHPYDPTLYAPSTSRHSQPHGDQTVPGTSQSAPMDLTPDQTDPAEMLRDPFGSGARSAPGPRPNKTDNTRPHDDKLAGRATK
ncbi:uncharacterized protein K460DRAFT_406558 [Cucurbitaria berberidis CBS 394.84]|uniref:Uncharacterized protein n=1 Tax=Cucurbitaria berberidis CBS 394.84 TaxID=1168544 RepID=A0A9P4L8S0_9PLEO|nr:uncharacterized protein K460DRAFT_406558 [Cucurbitaria berberidis CBS 394.84]KAF1846350.1 hypothetical protein K460DRAFT_406558 [Cucurbitaria berberidis CBS 394.84]